MLDANTVTHYSKKIEGMLARQFGAEGKGLHEKLSTVEHQIPSDVSRKIRYIASVRNKVIHDDAHVEEDHESFIRTGEWVITALEQVQPGNIGREWRQADTVSQEREQKFGSRRFLELTTIGIAAFVSFMILTLGLFLGISIITWHLAKRVFNEGNLFWGLIILIGGLTIAAMLNTALIMTFSWKSVLVDWPFVLLDLVCGGVVLYRIWHSIGASLWSWAKGELPFPWAFWRKKRTLSSSSTYDVPRDDYGASRARYTFKDVMGMEDLKEKLRNAVTNIETDGKNGILLTGDPGNGKTFIAEALAGELGLPFLPITFGDVASKWVNQTTEQVVAAFDSALRTAPCVMFLDEVDSLIKDRNRSSDGYPEQAQTTNTILTKLVDLRGSGVIILAASNFPDLLDRAATREGRFDFRIEVSAPDREARMGLLNVYLDKGLTYAEGVRERLARRWEGFSNVRIRTVVEAAAKETRKQGRREVSLNEMMEALREVQGSAGEKLAENTKTIAELSFAQAEKQKLLSLAKRMIDIDEVEKLGGTVPKGVLFYGPPGTGKTATAKALAKSSSWAFLPTTGQELFSSPDKVTELLKKAADIRPCIVFIDEADDILQDRESNRQSKASTNKLLAAMDGNLALPDVMFIAATNHPNLLDLAALRGGRFSEHFDFDVPDEATMKEIVSDWMKSKSSTPFAPCFTVEAAARLMMGLPPSDAHDKMQKAINQAITRTGRTSSVSVELNDLAAALVK